jgi:hypothetical protein
MNKQQRRKIEQLMEEDTCSICLTNLPNNTEFYGGVTFTGEAALVGACCRPKLKHVSAMGLYFAPHH